jgi:hypothetical protein
MRTAFHPTTGPLTDPLAEAGEKEARMFFFTAPSAATKTRIPTATSTFQTPRKPSRSSCSRTICYALSMPESHEKTRHPCHGGHAI